MCKSMSCIGFDEKSIHLLIYCLMLFSTIFYLFDNLLPFHPVLFLDQYLHPAIRTEPTDH